MCSAQEPQGVEGGYVGSNPHQMEVSSLLSTVKGKERQRKTDRKTERKDDREKDG